MRISPRLWRLIAAAFTLINLGGAWVAAVGGEAMHAGVHVGLTILGVAMLWPLGSRGRQRHFPAERAADDLGYLRQPGDASAFEIERLAEAQRIDAQFQAKRRQTPR